MRMTALQELNQVSRLPITFSGNIKNPLKTKGSSSAVDFRFGHSLPRVVSTQKNADTVQFGKFDHYRDVYQGLEGLAAYRPIHLDSLYTQLTQRQQGQVDQWLQEVSPSIMERYHSQKKLGLLEECSDVFFEFHILRALQKDIIREDRINALMPQLQTLAQQETGFPEMFEMVRDSLKPDQIKAFRKLLAVDDEKLVTNLLTLAHIKFALGKLRGISNDILTETKKRVHSESEELLEHLPKNWFYRAALRIQGWVFEKVPQLPASLFRQLPRLLTERQLGHALKPEYEDYFRFLFSKHSNRNELDFTNYPTLGYEIRKKIIKPFETLMEAAYLNRIEATSTSPVQQKHMAILN